MAGTTMLEGDVEGLTERALAGDAAAARGLITAVERAHGEHQSSVLQTLARLDYPVLWRDLLVYLAGKGWPGYHLPAPTSAVQQELQRLFVVSFGQPFLNRQEEVRAALRADSAPVRLLAAQLAGKQRDRVAIPALLPLLRDPSLDVRIAAAHALQAMPDLRAIEPLLDQLTTGDTGARRAAADALCAIGLPALPPLLTRLVRLPTTAVFRLAAAHVIPHLAVGAKPTDVWALEQALRETASGVTVPVAAHRLLCWYTDCHDVPPPPSEMVNSM
jgi:hypothetical protein